MLDIGTGSGALLLALLSELPNAVGTGTDISAAALGRRARQCRTQRPGRALHLRRLQYRRGRARAVRSDRVEPALYRAWRYRHRWRRRCATTTRRWRSTAAPTGSMVTAPSPREARRLLAPGGRLIVELGAGQEAGGSRAVYQSGIDGRRRAQRFGRHSARARRNALRHEHGALRSGEKRRAPLQTQKITWNMARKRLASGNGIDP